MAQLIKQLLTWYRTHDKAYDCVQAMVCFSWEGIALGAKARCYLSHGSSERADGVVISLFGHDPKLKYTGRAKPTKTQMNASVLSSQKRRNDEMNFTVQQTSPKK